MKTVDIVDYGVGNIGSIMNMLKKVGGTAQVVSTPEQLTRAEKLILPGVGAFDHGIQTLIDGEWIDALNDAVQSRHIPILGICLGMQLMCKASEEGRLAGLGWIDACVKRFNFESDQRPLKIPHMGWNVVKVTRANDLVSDLSEQQRYYFVHSYYVECNCTDDVFLMAEYGNEFVAGFQHENIWGVQFHPEKSHKFGMALLKKFLEV